MPNKTRRKKASGKLSKGLSIDQDLFDAVTEVAQRESRSFAYIVCRAVKRDLHGHKVTANTPQLVGQTDELMDIREAGRMLRLSVWTMRRRSRKAGDPIRLAKSRVGKQKPMQFIRSRIEQLEREMRGGEPAN